MFSFTKCATAMALLLSIVLDSHSQAETPEKPFIAEMENITLGIVSNKLIESKEFYVNYLDFEVVFENDWYIHMRAQSEPSFQIAFMQPEHPTQPPIFKPAFGGKGLFYTLEVSDVEALYEKLRTAGVDIEFPITDEDWGERHFALYDPNGVALNISQPIETITQDYKKDYKIELPSESQSNK